MADAWNGITMNGHPLNSLTIVLPLLVATAAVLMAGATTRQAWSTTRSALGVSVTISHILSAGTIGYVLMVVAGVLVGLDQALAMLRRDRLAQTRLARLSDTWQSPTDGAMTTTGQPIRLSGAAIIASVVVMYLAVHQAVSAVPAGSSLLVVLALVACLPVAPALLHRAGFRNPVRVRPRPMPHDPRIGLLLAAVVVVALPLAAFA